MYPKIEIDQQSGFCFGVINAVKHAEEELKKDDKELYCLGDIVHNNQEVDRLQAKGMQTIDYEAFKKLEGKRVLFRAHGEAPAIYQLAYLPYRRRFVVSSLSWIPSVVRS